MKNRIFLIALLTIAAPAHAMPAFLNDILLLADSPPQITTAYLDKTKYQLGDQMLITAETTDDWGTKKISAEIQTEKGTETTNLILIAGNSRKGTYQGAWKVHDTIGEKEYKTKIIATDLSGQTTEKTLVWTDPTQDHPASEITPGTFQAGNYGLQGRLYASDPTSTTFGTVGPYTAAFGTSPITGMTGDSNTYAGYFSGGKGVKISGNLEVTGKINRDLNIDDNADGYSFVTVDRYNTGFNSGYKFSTAGTTDFMIQENGNPGRLEISNGDGGITYLTITPQGAKVSGDLEVTGRLKIPRLRPCGNRGDVDSDLYISFSDARKIARCALNLDTSGCPPANGDVDGSGGNPNIDDAMLVYQYLREDISSFPGCNTCNAPSGGKYGDVNNDGKINATDSIWIAQYIVGTRTLTAAQLERADVINPPPSMSTTSAHTVTLADAVVIIQYYLGIRPVLPVCQAKPIPCIYAGFSAGDVNEDGKITMDDAYKIGRCTVNTDTCTNAGDVNGIDGVTIVDALFIAQYVVDIRPTLPVCLTQ